MYHEKAPEKRSVKQNIQSSPVKRLDKWQLLMNNYETKLGIQPTFAPVDQNIEDEYASYTSSRVVQTDILQFWQVCASFCYIPELMYWYLGQWANLSNNI